MSYRLSVMILLFLLASFSTGCNRRQDRLCPFGWESEGMLPDSLLLELSRMVYNYGGADTIAVLAGKYCEASAKEDRENKYEHRRFYWKGTAQFMSGNYEEGDSLRRLSVEMCDSARFPHDYLVYRFSVEEAADFSDNAARYQRYLDDLKAFIKFGDYANGFSRAVQVSQLMSEAGLHDRALEYALLADTLLSKAGLTVLRSNNRANIASCRFQAGDTIGAVEILRSLKANDLGHGDAAVKAIIDFNIYQMNGDTAALRSAWKTVERHPNTIRLRPLVAAAMIKNGKVGETDNKGMADYIREGNEYNYRAEELMYIKEAACDLAVLGEGLISLPDAIREYEDAVTGFVREQKRGELIAAAIAEEVSKVELKAQKEREYHSRILWGIITVAGILIVLAVIVVILHLNRIRQVKLLNQLEIERHKRRQIASDMLLEEKERLVDSLQGKIADFVAKDILKKSHADEMVGVLAEPYTRELSDTGNFLSKPSDHEEKEASREMSVQEFMVRFIDRYPKVGKTGRRLAAYLWQGLDTSDIAKEMNIRKESVMQARWRLRSQMGLTPEEDLEVVIRRLMC